MSKSIGENIKFIRKSLGLTQAEVAEKLYTTPQNISRVESGEGEPTVETLVGLSNLFGVSVDTLVGKTELYEEELFNMIQMYFKFASKIEVSDRVFGVCKNIFLGRYKKNFEKVNEELETYSTLKQGKILSVFSNRKDYPRIFAAVETNTVDLDEMQIEKLSKVFLSISDPMIFKLINKIYILPSENDLFYDKMSFCLNFNIDEKDFDYVLSSLYALDVIDKKIVSFNDKTVTMYKIQINEKIVLLLSLADLLYNSSPDGNIH